MSTLFPAFVEAADVPAIPGLAYISGYVNEEEESRLIQSIDAEPWDTSWERRRQSYGGAYGSVGTVRPIPSWGLELANRMHSDGLSERPFDQMLVNEYQPGQGIALHRDYQPFDRTVVSLSLLSSWVMDFRQANSEWRHSLLLERRSLLVLSDEARYDWQHGIARRKSDLWHGVRRLRTRRLSVTFRLLRTSR